MSCITRQPAGKSDQVADGRRGELDLRSLGVGSWLSWIKSRCLTAELLKKSNETGFILIGSVFTILGLANLLQY